MDLGLNNFVEDATSMPIIVLNNTSTFREKDIGIRTVVGISCGLSIIGSLLIIVSYFLQKNRTRAREILVHISLMDFGVAMSNLIGLLIYFDRFYSNNRLPPSHIHNMCKTQAFFAAYCTLGSFFWTAALAGYLYTVILHNMQPKSAIYFHRLCYILCYGLAFCISLWLILSGRLGYSPYDSAGWCSLIARNIDTNRVDLFAVVFGHDLWLYLVIFLIITLYVAIKSFLSSQLKISMNDHNISPKKFWSSLNFVDYKFILIPVMFILLRLCTCILTILFDYANLKEETIPIPVIKALIYLSGIGDSGQGFTNAILFVLFTKNVRQTFIKFICCCKCRKTRSHIDEEVLTTSDDTDEEGYITLECGKQVYVPSLLCGDPHDSTVQIDASYSNAI